MIRPQCGHSRYTGGASSSEHCIIMSAFPCPRLSKISLKLFITTRRLATLREAQCTSVVCAGRRARNAEKSCPLTGSSSSPSNSVEMPIPQVVEEHVEVSLGPQERIRQGTEEQIIDVLVRQVAAEMMESAPGAEYGRLCAPGCRRDGDNTGACSGTDHWRACPTRARAPRLARRCCEFSKTFQRNASLSRLTTTSWPRLSSWIFGIRNTSNNAQWSRLATTPCLTGASQRSVLLTSSCPWWPGEFRSFLFTLQEDACCRCCGGAPLGGAQSSG